MNIPLVVLLESVKYGDILVSPVFNESFKKIYLKLGTDTHEGLRHRFL